MIELIQHSLYFDGFEAKLKQNQFFSDPSDMYVWIKVLLGSFCIYAEIDYLSIIANIQDWDITLKSFKLFM